MHSYKIVFNGYTTIVNAAKMVVHDSTGQILLYLPGAELKAVIPAEAFVLQLKDEGEKDGKKE